MENKGIKVVIEKLFSACFVTKIAKIQGNFPAKTILFFIFFFYQYFVPSGTITVLSKSIEQEEISSKLTLTLKTDSAGLLLNEIVLQKLILQLLLFLLTLTLIILSFVTKIAKIQGNFPAKTIFIFFLFPKASLRAEFS